MHIRHHALSLLGTSKAPLRRTLLTLAVTLCTVLGLAVTGTTAANAAGPNYLTPGQSAQYPTWFWSNTTVCVHNLSGTTGRAVVRPTINPYNLTDNIYVGGYGIQCIQRSWWGNPIVVTNYSSSAFLKVWTS